MAVREHPSPVSDATSVIQSRHRNEIRRRAIRITIVVVVVVLVLGGAWAAWFSPWFTARSVQVTGNSQASTEQITQAADVPIGTPLVRVDVTAIRDRVTAIPAISSAKITREMSGVIRIAVTERTPVYAIQGDSQALLVDGGGLAYLVTDAVPDSLPVVTLPWTDVGSSTRLMSDAAVIVQALPDAVRTQMVSLGAQTPDTFTIALTNGAQILWGSSENSDQKAQVISGLLNVKATYYDVSSPSHPATK
ncbi:MAG: FtsQ-type POTRA domain-containing protein [Propionibacteriaceae bacterium]|nr:FtsQ-type POTRA domain-containing protein [Propionibacteriaceae bacterium]